MTEFNSPSSHQAAENHLEFYRRWHTLAAPYFRWQYEQFSPFIGRRVADVGCGPGNLTRFLLDRELYLGIDNDPAMLEELSAEYRGSGNVQVLNVNATASELPDILSRRKIDTVLCCNLLEHLEDDKATVSNLLRSLPAGGKLCLLVPAMPSIFGTLDMVDNHVRRYTKSTLNELFTLAPATIIRIHYFNCIGAIGWWWKGRVAKERIHADANYTVMNRLIPILRPLERLIPPPFGLSLIAIAVRT
jgi:SAM-dependent methyltransferase